jgi:glutamate synthase domain-containing protein 3
MTGGTVAVLGRTGRNFAAGMSGGVAYVYDEDGRFADRCNTAMVSLDKLLPAAEQEASVPKAVWHRIDGRQQADEVLLKKLIDDHHKWTGSLRARHILDHWAESRGKFVKVFPNEYKRALSEMAAKLAGVAERSAASAGAGTDDASLKRRSADKKNSAVPAK